MFGAKDDGGAVSSAGCTAEGMSHILGKPREGGRRCQIDAVALCWPSTAGSMPPGLMRC